MGNYKPTKIVDGKLVSTKTLFNFDHLITIKELVPNKNLDGKGYSHCKGKVQKPWRYYSYSNNRELLSHILSWTMMEAVMYVMRGGEVKLNKKMTMKLVEIDKDPDRIGSKVLAHEMDYWAGRIGDLSKTGYKIRVPKIIRSGPHTRNKKSVDVYINNNLYEAVKGDYESIGGVYMMPKRIHIYKLLWKVLGYYSKYRTGPTYNELMSKLTRVVGLLVKGADIRFMSKKDIKSPVMTVKLSQYAVGEKKKISRGHWTAKCLYETDIGYYEGKRKGRFYLGLSPDEYFYYLKEGIVHSNIRNKAKHEGVFEVYRCLRMAKMKYFYIIPIELDLDKGPVIELKRNGKLLPYFHWIGYLRKEVYGVKHIIGNINEKTVGKYL